MSFTSATTSKESMGSQFLVHGTFTNTGGSTGGDIATGLTRVNGFWMTPQAAAGVALAPVVNETFPLFNSTGAVTVATNANDIGYWYAFGV